jgi:hypothetical protein
MLSVIGLALAASLTSLGNGFAYDDQPIIVANPHVHSLAGFAHRFIETYWPAKDSAGLYRPLTILLFALQWAIGGGGPFVFHLVNVLLYAALAAAVFGLARQLLPEAGAWLAAALFAVHPVHVEAVANGVGQSELTAALAVVGALALYLSWRRSAPLQPLSGSQTAWLAGLYLVACGTKEHGVVLPALLLLAEFTVIEDSRAPRLRLAALFPALALLAGLGLGFLALRGWVLRDISPDIKAVSLLPLSTGQRMMTMLALAPEWLRLLFWPAHLQADYAPLETPIITTFQPSVGLGALLLGAGLALGALVRRRRPVVAFGVGWIAIALLPVSNLLVTSGQVLAERTMMLPSVGAVLVVGALAAAWMATGAVTAQARKLVGALAGIVVLAGGLRSAQRQPVWASDESLMSQTVLDAPRSHWAQWIYGDWLFVHGKPAEGERHMRLAVQLYPGNPYILRILGGRYQDNGLCQAAVPLFQHALELRPGWWEVQLRLAACYQSLGQPEAADQIVAACLIPGGAQLQLQALLGQNQGHPAGGGDPRP